MMARRLLQRKRGNTRESLATFRRREKARRENKVIAEALRLRGLPPAETIRMMMELSDLCAKLGAGVKR